MIKSSPSLSPPISSSPGDPLGLVNATLDLTGELCPFTFVRTKLALEDMALGDVLRVVVDHEPATRNIPRSATEWGQEMIAVTRLTQHTWAIDLRKRVR